MKKSDIKIGMRVRNNVAFSGIKKGTQGVVDEFYFTGDRSGIMVAWDLPERPLPAGYNIWSGQPTFAHGLLRDGFNIESELKFLDVVK